MGAEFWVYQTAYEPDADSALRRLQVASYQKAGYNLTKLLDERIRGMMESIRLCEEEDPYELFEHYRDCLRRLRQLAARGIPINPASQIALLRKIEAIASDSAPGIFAIEGVSRGLAERKVRLLTAKRMKEVFGTVNPSLQKAREGLERLADSIPRGSGICFPVYEGKQPVSWYFAGYTAD
jgi:hypothetical protein